MGRSTASGPRFEKLCDFSNKNIVAIVYNGDRKNGEEADGTSEGPAVRIFTPIDDGVKYCTKGSNLYDSPLLEIGLIAGIKEVHKKSITWIEWDYVGQLLVTADCTGCVGLWRLENIANDIKFEFVFRIDREIVSLMWLSDSPVWTIRTSLKESSDLVAPRKDPNSSSEGIFSNIIEDNIFRFFHKEHRKGPEFRTNTNVLCFLDVSGKFHLASKSNPEGWCIKCVDIIDDTVRGASGDTPHSESLDVRHDDLTILYADIRADAGNRVSIALIYKSRKTQDKRRLLIAMVTYIAEDQGAINSSMILEEDLDELFALVNVSEARRDEYIVPMMCILSGTEFLVAFTCAVKDCDAIQPTYLSIWNNKAMKNPAAAFIRKRTIYYDNALSMAKFTLPGSSGAESTLLAIVSLGHDDIMLYSLPDLRSVYHLFNVFSGAPDVDKLSNRSPFSDEGRIGNNTANGLVPPSRNARGASGVVEDICYRASILECIRDIQETKHLLYKQRCSYPPENSFFMFSPNKMILYKFSDYYSQNQKISDGDTSPHLFVKQENLFLKVKAFECHVLKNLRDKVADTLLNLLFLSVVNGVSYQDIINVAHCLEVELHHCGSIHPPFNVHESQLSITKYVSFARWEVYHTSNSPLQKGFKECYNFMATFAVLIK